MPDQKPSFPGSGNFLLEMLEHPDPPQADMQLPYPCRLRWLLGWSGGGQNLKAQPQNGFLPIHLKKLEHICVEYFMEHKANILTENITGC